MMIRGDMTEEIIYRGIQAAQSGDIRLARKLLIEAVRQHPDSAQAWFWLGNVLEDAEKKQYCHNRALQLDLALIEQAAQEPPDKSQTQPAEPVAAPPDRPAESFSAPPDRPETTHQGPRPRKLSLPVLAGLIGTCFLLILSCGAGVSFLTRGWVGFNRPLQAFRPPPLQETQTYERLGFQVTQAREALDNERDVECIEAYDHLLRQLPYWSIGYYNRGVCKRIASQNTNYFNEYEDHLKSAIKDQDQAIFLQPDYSNAYLERSFDYQNLMETEDNAVDDAILMEIAEDNLQAALALNTTHQSAQIQRVIVPLRSGKCAEALDEGYRQLDSTPAGKDLAVLYHMLAIGHLCQGEYTDALISVENSRGIEDTKGVIQVQTNILIGLGDLDQAFQLIDQSIHSHPDFGGYRYYLRALIYYEWGNYDLARQDLAVGYGSTWYHGGIYPYLMGMLEMQQYGDEAEAKKWIQAAAASVTQDESLWLKEKINAALARFDIQYREPKPKNHWKVTPIPD